MIKLISIFFIMIMGSCVWTRVLYILFLFLIDLKTSCYPWFFREFVFWSREFFQWSLLIEASSETLSELYAEALTKPSTVAPVELDAAALMKLSSGTLSQLLAMRLLLFSSILWLRPLWFSYWLHFRERNPNNVGWPEPHPTIALFLDWSIMLQCHCKNNENKTLLFKSCFILNTELSLSLLVEHHLSAAIWIRRYEHEHVYA